MNLVVDNGNEIQLNSLPERGSSIKSALREHLVNRKLTMKYLENSTLLNF